MYVESKVDFNLPKSKILKLITEPANLEKYHPFCKKNEIIKWLAMAQSIFWNITTV